MFSVWKMIKKGAVALACFAGPAILSILFKFVPVLNEKTVGGLIWDIAEKLMPGIPQLTLGAALIMLINWIKNRK